MEYNADRAAVAINQLLNNPIDRMSVGIAGCPATHIGALKRYFRRGFVAMPARKSRANCPVHRDIGFYFYWLVAHVSLNFYGLLALGVCKFRTRDLFDQGN